MHGTFKRFLRWPVEAAGFYLGLGLFACLPVEAASDLGGWLGRRLGPRSGLSRRAERNLRLAMPELSASERARIIAAMWDNLGRTAAEYAHLRTISDPEEGRVEFVGLENAEPTFTGERPGVAFSAHFANWEIMNLSVAPRAKAYTTVVREPNNPLVRDLLYKRRQLRGGEQVPKGTDGARKALATLRRKGLVAMLVDQRMSDGIAVPFFGHAAMTAAAPAQMAIRFDAAFYPTRLERLGPARFRMTMLPSLELPADGSRAERVAALTARANAILEEWIRERPAEWLWLHRRWPKDAYREAESRTASE